MTVVINLEERASTVELAGEKKQSWHPALNFAQFWLSVPPPVTLVEAEKTFKIQYDDYRILRCNGA